MITSHFAIAIRPSALLALGLLGRKNLGDQGMPPPHLSTYVRALKMIPHSYFSYEYVYLSPGYSWQPVNPFYACQSLDVSTVHHWKCDIGVCFLVNWGERIIISYFPKQKNSIVMSQYRVLCPETADTSSVSEFSVATMMNRIIASNSVLSCSADVWGIGREL